MKEKSRKFSTRARLNSFRFAFAGLRDLLRYEHNFRIHLVAMMLAIALAFYLGLSAGEWVLLILLIALVLICEAVNSALELLADEVSPDKNENIRKLKDYSAAAVLLASIAALAGGIILFLPRLLDLIGSWLS